MRRAQQIIHFTCTDPEDPLACFTDAVCDIHHWAAAADVEWQEAVAAADQIFSRERERAPYDGEHTQDELLEICRASALGTDPDRQAGMTDQEARLERAALALEGIPGPDGTPAATPDVMVSQGIGSLRFAAERFGVGLKDVMRKADSNFAAEAAGF